MRGPQRARELPKVLTVASAYRPEERAHVAATLASTFVQWNRRVALVDLDPTARATRQTFGPQHPPPAAGTAPLLESVGPEDLQPLRLRLFRRRLFVRSVYLFVLPSSPQLRRLEDETDPEVTRRLRAALTALSSFRQQFELILIDAPQLPSKLGCAAVALSDQVLVPVRTGVGCEAEIRAAARGLCGGSPERGGKSSPRAIALTATGALGPQLGEVNLALERLEKQFLERGSAVLLKSRLQHDLAVLGAHGVEYETRDAWIELAAELWELLWSPARE